MEPHPRTPEILQERRLEGYQVYRFHAHHLLQGLLDQTIGRRSRAGLSNVQYR
jgi:hypothetical protein